METFFSPTSIAIVGVSDKPSNMAKNILANLQEFAFDGLIYCVGYSGGKIFGRRIYKSVADIPDQVELAVILTPADTIPTILEECGQKGIRHAIVESAGFREFGDEGKKREEKVLAVAKKYDIRFIGPNCIGTINLKNGLVLPFLKFNDVFTRGRVSIVSQSGGVALTFLNLLSSESIGVAKIASIGNKLNIDENDVIEYLLKDNETDIILVYIEGISNGRRLMQLASSSPKPILLYKANIGKLGKVIAASHTAALSSNDDVVDAALKQAGIARFKDRTTLVNYLKILPLPRIRGKRLAILSRSGGHAIIAADAAEENGFELAPFNPSFIKEIESHVRANVIRLTNPLDLGDLFDYDLYLKIIERTIQEPYVDGVVFLHAYFSSTEGAASRRLIDKTNGFSHTYNKPIGVCVATDEEEVSKLRKNLQQPVFTSPLEIINALALSRDFHCGTRAKVEAWPVKADRECVTSILKQCKREERSPLLQEGLSILEAYQIPVIPSKWVTSENEAVAAADSIGYPVVMKISSREISHKSDVGGVHLNLKNQSHVREAYAETQETVQKIQPRATIKGFIIQPMLRRGWEMILGAKQDPNFGPIVLVGMGGIFVEVFKDAAMRVVPFTKSAAEEMLAELKGYPILMGARSGKRYDTSVIVNSIMLLSTLIGDFPDIKEIDINPFYVLPEGEGGMALDARIVL